jgi:HAD superfamily hydrolase (TIGR01509 family)
MKIKGLASDMDGIVANTEEFWYRGVLMFLKKYGKTLTRDEYSKLIGTTEIDDAKFFKKKFGIRESIEKILNKRRLAILEMMDTGIDLNYGYQELLELLRKKGIKISLVSTSPKVIIDKVIKKTGVKKYFTSIVSVEDAGTKVDAYIQATKSMGLKPSECFALEDSIYGGHAAKEAGLYCVVIPNPFIIDGDFSFADEKHKTIKDFIENGKILKEVK